MITCSTSRCQKLYCFVLELVISASVTVLVKRSRRPFFKRKPGKLLSISTIVIVLAMLIIPFMGLGLLFGSVPLPISCLVLMGLIIVLYVGAVERAKVSLPEGACLNGHTAS